MPAPTALPFDVNSFIANYQTTLKPEEIAGITELSKGYLREQDYQRNMNLMKGRQQQFEQQYDSDYQRLKGWEADAQEAMRVRDEVERRFGSIDRFRATSDPNVLVTPSGDYVAKAEVDQLVGQFNTRIQQLEQNFNNFAEGTYHMVVKMPSYAEQYRQRHNESFDGKAFMDFLDQNRIVDPDIGYKLFTSEKEQTKIKEDHAKELKDAEERGARNFATTHHIPETAGTSFTRRSPLMQPLRPVTTTTTTTSTPATPPAPPVTATATTTTPQTPAIPSRNAADNANNDAIPLAQRMQADFMRVKDQP